MVTRLRQEVVRVGRVGLVGRILDLVCEKWRRTERKVSKRKLMLERGAHLHQLRSLLPSEASRRFLFLAIRGS